MKTISLTGTIGIDITAENLKEKIDINSKEKLQVVVNSWGGFVVDAFAMYNIFYDYAGEVEFVLNGAAASAMSYLIMSGAKISAYKNSIFMGHRVQTFAIGDADILKTEAQIAEAMDNVIAES